MAYCTALPLKCSLWSLPALFVSLLYGLSFVVDALYVTANEVHCPP